MIRSMLGMFYKLEPETMREYFRDKLGFAAHDVGGGWLIFDMREADLGWPSNWTGGKVPPRALPASHHTVMT